MSTHSLFAKTETPCIGICSTIYGDEICRGCFRSNQEVIDWNTLDDPQKLEILNKLHTKLITILQNKLEVLDPQLLQQKCQQFNVKIRPTWHPLTWAHALLREGIHRIKNPENFGIRVIPPHNNLRIPKFVEMLDDEIYHAAHRSL